MSLTFQNIFEAYYNLYRGEAATPLTTDDEYVIAIRLANEAIQRWANFDGTYWKELFQTNRVDGTGAQTLVASQQTYAAPTNMKEAGGSIKIINASGQVTKNIPIIESQDAQFRNTNSNFCYFTGSANLGFILHINQQVSATDAGSFIDYVYYKLPTLISSDVTLAPTGTPDMANPYFMVHRMLAQRFRVSRNPYYTSALRDAEDALKVMQMDNNSGTWADPWKLADNSGTTWGQ